MLDLIFIPELSALHQEGDAMNTILQQYMEWKAATRSWIEPGGFSMYGLFRES